jgi:predicted GNAT family acetyltransferase
MADGSGWRRRADLHGATISSSRPFGAAALKEAWSFSNGTLGRWREMDVRVVDNPEELRYELWLGATRAGFIQYRSEPGTILLVHTEVEPAFEGQGLGARLVTGALDDLRTRDLRLVALCPFVRAYLRHHREYADLVARGPAVPE